jgi:primosomal protein N' (replication factor Y)
VIRRIRVPAGESIAKVVPDVTALDRPLDYLIPAHLDADIRIGTVVRVPLHGRRVRGWVIERASQAATDRPLQPVAKVTGWGPGADLVDLARWAAWRWAGPRVTFLRAASPPGAVRTLPAPPDRSGHVSAGPGAAERDRNAVGPAPMVVDAFSGGPVVVRLPPASDAFDYVAEAARRGDALVLAPSVGAAALIAARLRRSGHAVALLPGDWARAAAGCCVAVGARGAAWAPRPSLAAVVVVDEHDEGWQEERAPTWNGRDVAVERARRAGAPCVLVSACPSLDTLASMRLLTPSRSDEREGWPIVEVIDRRTEEPGAGLYSTRLVALVRQAEAGRRVVCVLNRRGRARLLACSACGELARCEPCGALVEEVDDTGTASNLLRCRRCLAQRPVLCAACGSTRLRVLRVGVSRAREDLERLAGIPVDEVTGDAAPGPLPSAPVLVGTSAVLHRVARAWAVVFLDLDQELLAPRWRAAEQAMAQLVRAARVVGSRPEGGRIVVQTRLPDHEVIDAAVHADPSRLAVVESARRAALGFPPHRAVAVVSGASAEVFAAAVATQPGVEVLGPNRDQWLVRAADHERLSEALAGVARPKGRLRVAVDPLRV